MPIENHGLGRPEDWRLTPLRVPAGWYVEKSIFVDLEPPPAELGRVRGIPFVAGMLAMSYGDPFEAHANRAVPTVRDDYLIDLDWRPEEDASGRFVLRLTHVATDELVGRLESRDRAEVREVLEAWMWSAATAGDRTELERTLESRAARPAPLGSMRLRIPGGWWIIRNEPASLAQRGASDAPESALERWKARLARPWRATAAECVVTLVEQRGAARETLPYRCALAYEHSSGAAGLTRELADLREAAEVIEDWLEVAVAAQDRGELERLTAKAERRRLFRRGQ